MIECITIGGGCFWCMEAVFQKINGVKLVIPGYADGTQIKPSYEQVCTGDTGHAEVIKIKFNTYVVDIRTLLEIFFQLHNPTTPNQQGNDVGSQYRSLILYQKKSHKIEAEKIIAKINTSKMYANPIVTKVKPLDIFYEAETNHHNYYQRNKNKQYCVLVIKPKLDKLHSINHSILE